MTDRDDHMDCYQHGTVPDRQPIAYASLGQLEFEDKPDHPIAGTYIPLRKTLAGNFTTPLYAEPNPDVSLAEAARDLIRAMHDGQQHVGFRLDLWNRMEACLGDTKPSDFLPYLKYPFPIWSAFEHGHLAEAKRTRPSAPEFPGIIIGWYERTDGHRGYVLEHDPHRIVHVYPERAVIARESQAGEQSIKGHSPNGSERVSQDGAESGPTPPRKDDPMSEIHARAHESEALAWLAAHDPRDGINAVIGEKSAADPLMIFTQPVVIDAFEAGWRAAAGRIDALETANREWLEKSRWFDEAGQRGLYKKLGMKPQWGKHRADAIRAVLERMGDQLTDAQDLLRAAAERFREYEAHHSERALSTHVDGSEEAAEKWQAAIDKKNRNAEIAEHIEQFLATGAVPEVSLAVETMPVPEIDPALLDQIDQAARDAARATGIGNLKPVIGPLSDPDVIEGVLASAGALDTTGTQGRTRPQFEIVKGSDVPEGLDWTPVDAAPGERQRVKGVVEEWGEPIAVDGTRPGWLRDETFEWTNDYGSHGVVTAYDRRNWDGMTWRACVSISLPASHPYYLATSRGFTYWPGGKEAPSDWNVGTVLDRAGRELCFPFSWVHNGSATDVIGYYREPAADPAATVATIEEAVRSGLVPGLTGEMLDEVRAAKEPYAFTTEDPRWSLGDPVTINGFLYIPAKEA